MTADRASGAAPPGEGGGRRRARDRGFERPAGPPLVARPEPLANAPAPVPGAPTGVPVDAEPVLAPQPSPAAAAAEAKPKKGAGDSLPMPPSRHVEMRVQFNTKLRPVTITRTKAFADHHQASIQDVVEMALDEYLTRRGWPAGSDS